MFAGSYISCIVQQEIDDYSKNSSAECAELTDAAETTVPVTSTAETITVSQTETARATEVPVTTVSETETAPETTVVSTAETTAEVTETPVQTEPVPVYNYGVPVPASDNPKSSSYFDQCAFIGDSHIKGLSGYKIVSDGRVFAQNGMSIAHISDYISVNDITKINPSNVYFMMGTNGVMWLKWEDMISQYEAFIKQVEAALPDAKIYIFSIPPVSAGREAKPDVASGKYLNSEIDGYNAELLKMAEKNQWYFADMNSAVKNASGCLDDTQTNDGIHMSVELYSVFADYILNHTVD